MSGKVKHALYIHNINIYTSLLVSHFQFQKRTKNPCFSTGLYSKRKIVEGSYEMQKCLLTLGHFFKMYLSEAATFFLANIYPVN